MSGDLTLLSGPQFVPLLTTINYGLPQPLKLVPPYLVSPLLSYLRGTGRITGTVKNTPNTPVSRRVALLREPSLQMVAETVSDSATGAYVFDRINAAATYTVVSYDHTETFRAVIADRVLPEVIP